MSQSTLGGLNNPSLRRTATHFVLNDTLPPPVERTSIPYILNGSPLPSMASMPFDAAFARNTSQFSAVRKPTTPPWFNPARPARRYSSTPPESPGFPWRKSGGDPWLSGGLSGSFWGSEENNPFHVIKNRLDSVKNDLPPGSFWHCHRIYGTLATFSYWCWKAYGKCNHTIQIMRELANGLMADLNDVVRAVHSQEKVPENEVPSLFLGKTSTGLHRVPTFRYILQSKQAQMEEIILEKLRQKQKEEEKSKHNEEGKGKQKEEDKTAQEAWDGLAADKYTQEVKEQELRRAIKEQETIANPTATSPRSLTGIADPSNRSPTASIRRQRSKTKRKSTSTAKYLTTKRPMKDPLPQTVARLIHSATPPQSFAAPRDSASPAPQLSVEPWNLPSPEWASTYQPGMLKHLGLTVGMYGTEGTDVRIPPHKLKRPGSAGNPVQKKPMSWNWGLYTILARIPGGKAKLNVLYNMCVEWCPDIEAKNTTCRHALATKKDWFFFFVTKEDSDGNRTNTGWWRLTDEGEKRKSGPGPKKGVAPQTNWSKEKIQKGKASSHSKKGKAKQNNKDKTSSPKELSMIDLTDMSPRCVQETEVPQLYEEIKAAQALAQTPTQDSYVRQQLEPKSPKFATSQALSQPSTSGSSSSSSPSSQPSNGITERPVISATVSSLAAHQWTAVNTDPTSAPNHRKALPSGPAKRQRDKKEGGSEPTKKQRQRSDSGFA